MSNKLSKMSPTKRSRSVSPVPIEISDSESTCNGNDFNSRIVEPAVCYIAQALSACARTHGQTATIASVPLALQAAFSSPSHSVCTSQCSSDREISQTSDEGTLCPDIPSTLRDEEISSETSMSTCN